MGLCVCGGLSDNVEVVSGYKVVCERKELNKGRDLPGLNNLTRSFFPTLGLSSAGLGCHSTGR